VYSERRSKASTSNLQSIEERMTVRMDGATEKRAAKRRVAQSCCGIGIFLLRTARSFYQFTARWTFTDAR
jgi:hypothetical protein